MRISLKRDAVYGIILAICLMILNVGNTRAETFTIFLEPLQDANVQGDPANFVGNTIDRGDFKSNGTG